MARRPVATNSGGAEKGPAKQDDLKPVADAVTRKDDGGSAALSKAKQQSKRDPGEGAGAGAGRATRGTTPVADTDEDTNMNTDEDDNNNGNEIRLEATQRAGHDPGEDANAGQATGHGATDKSRVEAVGRVVCRERHREPCGPSPVAALPLTLCENLGRQHEQRRCLATPLPPAPSPITGADGDSRAALQSDARAQQGGCPGRSASPVVFAWALATYHRRPVKQISFLVEQEQTEENGVLSSFFCGLDGPQEAVLQQSILALLT